MLSPAALIQLYPRAWRERYGDEFAALLEDCGVGPRTILDVLLGAFDAHIGQRASARAAAQAHNALVVGGKVTVGTMLGIALALLVWVFAVSLEGGQVWNYLLPSPTLLVVGGTLAALLIGYGTTGLTSLPGLFALAMRGPASVTGTPTAAAVARYRLGRDIFHSAGTFALLIGVVTTILGLMIALEYAGNAPPDQVWHAVAVTLTGFLYGFVVAIFCYALSANLRHKGEQLDGTLRALEEAAAGLVDVTGAARRLRSGTMPAPAGAS